MSDLVAVVTGASSGIGEATARALVASGYRVALLARRADRIDALAAELGDGSIAIEADVTDRDQLLAAAERVRHELGPASVLINNAGIMLLGPFSADQREDYRRMIDVNLLGAITTTEVFLDQLTAGEGDVINISSVAGRTARAGNGGVRGHEMGTERMVRVAASRAPPGCPGDLDRARRRGHRAPHPHHPRADQRGGERRLQPGHGHRGRHRGGHRVRAQPASAPRNQRDPAAAGDAGLTSLPAVNRAINGRAP
ncbi:hypothetical protein ABH923_002459 [Leifsonia sp. EB41]